MGQVGVGVGVGVGVDVGWERGKYLSSYITSQFLVYIYLPTHVSDDDEAPKTSSDPVVFEQLDQITDINNNLFYDNTIIEVETEDR